MSQNIEIVEIQSSSCSARFVSEEERQMIKTRNSDDLEEQRQTYLRRITSEELQMMREIFDTLDVDHTGFIRKSELKKYVSEHPLENVPVNLVKNIMQMSDKNLAGEMNFDEFCDMDTKYKWLFTRYIRRYVNFVTSKPKSYEHSMSIYPLPLTMLSVSFIEIIVFLLDLIHKAIRHPIKNNGRTTSGRLATLFIYNPYRRHEAWRFFTYMFVHAGVIHILINLIVQIFIGFSLEMRNAWWRVAIVYVAGVLAASMGHSIMEPEYCLCGASGGVYAIITAHIAVAIMNWSEMEFKIVRVFVFSLFLITDFGYSAYLHYHKIHVPGYTAHLFGALAGLLVGIVALKKSPERRRELKLWWWTMSIYFLLMFAGIFTHTFFAHELNIPSWNPQVQCA